jgi:hypothetical protein
MTIAVIRLDQHTQIRNKVIDSDDVRFVPDRDHDEYDHPHEIILSDIRGIRHISKIPNYIDFFQIHNLTDWDGIFPLSEEVGYIGALHVSNVKRFYIPPASNTLIGELYISNCYDVGYELYNTIHEQEFNSLIFENVRLSHPINALPECLDYVRFINVELFNDQLITVPYNSDIEFDCDDFNRYFFKVSKKDVNF